MVVGVVGIVDLLDDLPTRPVDLIASVVLHHQRQPFGYVPSELEAPLSAAVDLRLAQAAGHFAVAIASTPGKVLHPRAR